MTVENAKLASKSKPATRAADIPGILGACSWLKAGFWFSLFVAVLPAGFAATAAGPSDLAGLQAPGLAAADAMDPEPAVVAGRLVRLAFGEMAAGAAVTAPMRIATAKSTPAMNPKTVTVSRNATSQAYAAPAATVRTRSAAAAPVMRSLHLMHRMRMVLRSASVRATGFMTQRPSPVARTSSRKADQAAEAQKGMAQIQTHWRQAFAHPLLYLQFLGPTLLMCESLRVALPRNGSCRRSSLRRRNGGSIGLWQQQSSSDL